MHFVLKTNVKKVGVEWSETGEYRWKNSSNVKLCYFYHGEE